jgi:diguanylate cyclase (GGDEF)-like protein/PAS domain S-box-containing protein
MQGPVVDVVILLLMVLFFGRQQRSRPELFFRFWFAGWVAVSLSVMVGVVPLAPDQVEWSDVMRANGMLLAGMAFLLSFLVTRGQLRRMILIGLTFAVPALMVMDVAVVGHPPAWLLGGLLLVGQAGGMHAVHLLVPPEWVARRRALIAICLGFGAAMLAMVPASAQNALPNLIVAEVFLSVAVLYCGAYARRGFTGLAGALGFVAWGTFYLVPVWLPETTGSMRVFYEFWNVPKYFVGFAMVLQTFEDSRNDFERLAKVYGTLYRDFRMMYENHPHPMWIYDAATKKVLSVNVAATEDYGFSEQELLELRMTDLELAEEGEQDPAHDLLLQPTDGHRTRHRHKDGSVAWVHVVDRGILFQGAEARLVIARDVTRQMDINRELARQAHHDALTGLPNRVLLEDRIRHCLDRSAAGERKAVLLTIDIDHFKVINDTYGHLVGDECLKAVAGRLKSKIRQVDTIARAGGEEFIAIVGGLRNVADARKVTAALLGMFEAPVRLSCGVISVTVSIGGAMFPDDGLEITELQAKSDQALYAAKRGGRNRAMFASTTHIPGAGERPAAATLAAIG